MLGRGRAAPVPPARRVRRRIHARGGGSAHRGWPGRRRPARGDQHAGRPERRVRPAAGRDHPALPACWRRSASSRSSGWKRAERRPRRAAATPSSSATWPSAPSRCCWGPPRQRTWMAQLERAHDNMRAALAWSVSADGVLAVGVALAGALGWFWLMSGRLQEAQSWYTQLLARRGEADDSLAWAKVLHGSALQLWGLGDLAQAAALEESAVEIFRSAGEGRWLSYGLALLAQVRTGQAAAGRGAGAARRGARRVEPGRDHLRPALRRLPALLPGQRRPRPGRRGHGPRAPRIQPPRPRGRGGRPGPRRGARQASDCSPRSGASTPRRGPGSPRACRCCAGAATSGIWPCCC